MLTCRIRFTAGFLVLNFPASIELSGVAPRRKNMLILGERKQEGAPTLLAQRRPQYVNQLRVAAGF